MFDLPLVNLFSPSSRKNNDPFLIMLHGYGSNERDLFSFIPELPKELNIISLRAPYKLNHDGFYWYEINFDNEMGKFININQAKNSMNLILNCINKISNEIKIDISKASLIGFSQGCILSMALGLNYPEKFKNIIGLSGYIPNDFTTIKENKEVYKNLNFYSSHGIFDQVIPIKLARETPKILDKLNINFTYNEFSSSHGVSNENFKDMKEWLVKNI